VQVQGAGAAEQIAAAIDQCNEYGDLDVIIAGRGGGSLEDLWAFNEEIVARAIHRSRIPVVSAVGHEVDFTIADFVADVRAATPSVAAELVVPDRGELSGHLEEVARRMGKFVDFTLHQKRLDVSRLGRHWVFRKPEQALQRSMQQLDDLQDRMMRAVALTEERAGNSLRMLSRDIDAHNPRRILSKGYVMVRRGDDIMESASAIRAGDRLNLVFRDGNIEAHVSQTDAAQ
jgi:exodeoxyribonuclease VII large subunit